MSEPGDVSTLADAVRLLAITGMSPWQIAAASGADVDEVEQVLAAPADVLRVDDEDPPPVRAAFPVAGPMPATPRVVSSGVNKHGARWCGSPTAGGACGCVGRGRGERRADFMTEVW